MSPFWQKSAADVMRYDAPVPRRLYDARARYRHFAASTLHAACRHACFSFMLSPLLMPRLLPASMMPLIFFFRATPPLMLMMPLTPPTATLSLRIFAFICHYAMFSSLAAISRYRCCCFHGCRRRFCCHVFAAIVIDDFFLPHHYFAIGFRQISF